MDVGEPNGCQQQEAITTPRPNGAAEKRMSPELGESSSHRRGGPRGLWPWKSVATIRTGPRQRGSSKGEYSNLPLPVLQSPVTGHCKPEGKGRGCWSSQSSPIWLGAGQSRAEKEFSWLTTSPNWKMLAVTVCKCFLFFLYLARLVMLCSASENSLSLSQETDFHPFHCWIQKSSIIEANSQAKI